MPCMAYSKIPRSIHDADSERGRRSRVRKERMSAAVSKVLRPLGALLALGAVGGGLYWGLAGKSADEGMPLSTTGGVSVYVDGWSFKTVNATELTYKWGSTGIERGTKLRPATGPELENLLATDPGIVETALARQLVPAHDLVCAESGCTAGDREVAVTDLLLEGEDPGQELLRRLGVKSGLYVADIPSDTSGEGLEVSLGSGLNLNLGVVDDTQRTLVSAGLGQLFVPEAAWLSGEGAARAEVLTVGAASVEEVIGVAPQVVAAHGLGVALPEAAYWNASQLTLATSVSQGCRAGVLCFPGVVDAAEDVRDIAGAAVYTHEGSEGVVLLDDRVISVHLPAEINQVGFDEPIGGTQELRFVTAVLYQGGPPVEIDRGGFVTNDLDGTHSVQDALDNVSFAGEEWSAQK